MKLTPTQALEIVQTPVHKKEIDSVKAVESQLRVFTEELDKDELNSEDYWSTFTKQMQTRSPQKADRVLQFARYPLPIAQISDSILSDLFKVFDGKNRHFNVDGDRDLSVLKKWIIEQNLEKWIESRAREVLKNKPCSFIVLDVDDSGKPYLVFVDSRRLVDASFANAKGDLDYICFIHSTDTDINNVTITRFSVYDDSTYYVFEKRSDSDIYKTISTKTHRVGYCPARAFISTASSNHNVFKRRVAFTPALSKMEDWTLFDIYRNFSDHYAPFPVIEAPRRQCPNPDCENGAIKTETFDPRAPEQVKETYVKCQLCEDANGELIGPGTQIGIDIQPTKDMEDGSGKFKIHYPDADNLKYVPQKLVDLELEIRHKTVGLNQMTSVNESVNEMQLKGSFASMESVLLRTKEDLDGVYKWIVTTTARLFYKDISLKVDANFGTEFYLITEEELQARFKAAKLIGLPQDEMMMIYNQLIDTKYKGNPNKVERQRMLLLLDPLPLYTVAEVTALGTQTLIDPETMSMKINFISFVQRFEIENAPITQFGVILTMEERIKRIKAELDFYNNEALEKTRKAQEEKAKIEKPPVK